MCASGLRVVVAEPVGLALDVLVVLAESLQEGIRNRTEPAELNRTV